MRRSIEMVLQLLFSRTFLLGHVREACFFLRKKRDRLKALLWEEDGFLLMYKRLDNGAFQWPRSESEVKLLTQEQFVWLMQGLSVEQPKAIRRSEKHKDII